MKPDSCNSYPSSQQSSYNNGSSSCGNNRIRVIRLRRRCNVPLGFSVRGGREHGTGIFVSEVKVGSEAHHQGLLVGDQILRINGFNIEHAIHDEVLALLRAKPGVVIKVKSMGMIPVKDTKKDPLTWKIVDPGPSLPEYNGKSLPNSMGEEGIETRLSIPAIGASGLGCSIVKGPPDTPGIYVQSVKSGSLAEKAGLQVGDRIMEMNGHNFTNLDFTDAVAVLKSSKQMSLVLCKGVGLDLFPEEKLRRISDAQTTGKHGEIKKLSSVPEEEPRDDRDAKKTNGHVYKVKKGSELKPNEGEIKQNRNSSCSDSDVSCQQFIQDGVIKTKPSNCVKVLATVHSSSGEEENTNFRRNCARESGDGMDFECMNGNKNLPKNNGLPWDNGKYDFKDKQMQVKSPDSDIQPSIDTCSEDESTTSSLIAEKEIFKENGVSRHIQFLSEIQLHGDKSSVTSDEKSELSSLSSDDYLGFPKITLKTECTKPPNEFLKRKQHELLMEEFREVHKKMFGQGPPRPTKPQKQVNGDFQDQCGQYRRRQQVRKDRVTPPPPPPPDMNGQLDSSENYSSFKRAESIEDLCDTDGKTFAKRQREPPITDSRDPEPKPPQTYFDKGPKPLVTIGTYSNNCHQNRFMNNDVANIKSKQSQFENKLPFTSQGKGEVTFTVVHQKPLSSSSNSTIPSSSSSEPRSPTSESLESSDSLFNQSSFFIQKENGQCENVVPINNMVETVPNSFQMSLSQFSKNEKKITENAKMEKSKHLPNSWTNKLILSGNNKIGQTLKNPKNDTNKEVLEREAEGREMKTITLKKNGPLNFRIEGGVNSDLAGKILVSEVWAGSCITEGGKIELGDQILMVDNTKLTGLSLTAANVALRNANSNTNKEMKLIIAKSIKENIKEPSCQET